VYDLSSELSVVCLYNNVIFLCCRALVFICHGLGEHVRCYDSHAKMLADQGYLVFGHDHGEMTQHRLIATIH